VVYKFEGPINTDFSGCKRIIGLQDYCKDLYNQTIALDFYDCQWFDANLSALLLSIIHKLGHEQKLNFSTDIDFLKQRFEVLFRIGLISDGNAYEDVQETTVPLQSFSVNDKKAYTQYINGPLLQHRGFPTIEEPMRAKIADDLLEIFCTSSCRHILSILRFRAVLPSKEMPDIYPCGSRKRLSTQDRPSDQRSNC
jgi:hypothetical protein